MRSLAFAVSLLLAQPALAQHHDHPAGHRPEAPAPAPAPTPAPPAEPDHSAMDHGQMDHGHAGQGVPSQGAAIPEGPPPAAALSGPLHAADAAYGADVMAASRRDLAHEMGGMNLFWFQGDRLEWRAHRGQDGYLWDVQGFWGGDLDKLWFKSEGEGAFGESPEDAEVQALWSRAVAPFWDFQAGLRQDLTGPKRTHAVIGMQGIAPYQYEIAAALFFSHKGDVTVRIEAELDQRVTQRLILQPRVELEFAAQDVPELGIGAGLDHAALGVRLRYEFSRQFAPYLGIEHEQKFGQSKRFARTEGEDPGVTSAVAGVRFWF